MKDLFAFDSNSPFDYNDRLLSAGMAASMTSDRKSDSDTSDDLRSQLDEAAKAEAKMNLLLREWEETMAECFKAIEDLSIALEKAKSAEPSADSAARPFWEEYLSALTTEIEEQQETVSIAEEEIDSLSQLIEDLREMKNYLQIRLSKISAASSAKPQAITSVPKNIFTGEHRDENENIIAYSHPGIISSVVHKDKNHNIVGRSYKNAPGMMKHFDNNGRYIGYSKLGFWGTVKHYDAFGNLIANSNRLPWKQICTKKQ